MENQNEFLESLKKELNNYQEENKNDSGGRKSREEVLAKYFVPRADKETFRILPPLPGLKPIQEAFFHVSDLNNANGKKLKGKAIYCSAHNDPFIEKKDDNGNVITDQDGKPVMIPRLCPLCEKAKKILKRQDQSLIGKKRDEVEAHQQEQWDKNKEIFMEANKWQAKKYYIVRGIDKGKSKDGVKFWRFKKNFKKQGPLDKLLPVLNQYIEANNVAYFDQNNGADLTITMVDSEIGSVKFRAISAIIASAPTKLHEDPIIAQQWVNDPITWRDVFKPKAAPNITPFEYLELLAEGNDPYWDESDQNNKHWVFPGRPDLQEKANQRSRNLDAEESYDNFEQASDLAAINNINNDGVTIDNVTKSDVGSFNNDKVPNAVDITETVLNAEKQEENKVEPTTQPTEQQTTTETGGDGLSDEVGGDGYDDLPF